MGSFACFCTVLLSGMLLSAAAEDVSLLAAMAFDDCAPLGQGAGDDGQCAFSALQLRSAPARNQRQAASSEPEGYELVGRGWCLDAHGQHYEQWYVPAGMTEGLIFKGEDLDSCRCPECQRICDEFVECVGYNFFCCREGDRCFGGAAVLFGQGRRPNVSPPGNFGVEGVRGSPTSGEGFEGTGPIRQSDGDDWMQAFCYRKSEASTPLAMLASGSSPR